MINVKFGSFDKLWLPLLQLRPFGEDGGVEQISKISFLHQNFPSPTERRPQMSGHWRLSFHTTNRSLSSKAQAPPPL